MSFKMQLNNVYAIDSYMFNYPHYASCYLIKGKELAMVDTGMPEHLNDVLKRVPCERRKDSPVAAQS